MTPAEWIRRAMRPERVRGWFLSARVPTEQEVSSILTGHRLAVLEAIRPMQRRERVAAYAWGMAGVVVLLVAPVGAALVALVGWALGARAALVAGFLVLLYLSDAFRAVRRAWFVALLHGLIQRGLVLALLVGAIGAGCAAEVVEVAPAVCEPVGCELAPEDPQVVCPWGGAVVLVCDLPLPQGCGNIGQAAPVCVDGSPAGAVLACCCEGWGSPGYDCGAGAGGAP